MTLDKLTVRKSPLPNGPVIVEGKAAPNATVIVENKSIATFAPGDTADAFVRAQASADGRFSLELPAAREGDHLRVRSGLGVLSVRVANVEAIDGRPPVIHQQGIRLVEDGPGSFCFTHVQKSDVVGEPGQVLRFKNPRGHQDITLDDDGRLPKDARLEGRPGDVFQIATTDGVHNTSLRAIAGALVAPPASAARTSSEPVEPPPLSAHASKRRVALTGPLFNGEPAPGTVKQGDIGDCWLVSAADAIAARAPHVLRERIKDNDDGTVTVTFQRFDHGRSRYVDEPVTVTSEVHGATTYGQSTTGERWFPLLEKAYAQWKGGYDAIRSGYPFEAFEALLGVEGKHFDLDVSSADAVWRALTKAKDGVMVTWSRVESRALAFTNTGLVADHAYAIFGVAERNGERLVTLRNPWGSNGWAAGNGPLKMNALEQGVLEMRLEVFMKYFAGLGIASQA